MGKEKSERDKEFFKKGNGRCGEHGGLGRTVNSNGFMMAFYRASENDEWVYSEAISGQALPECSQLSEEEKMAFTNEWCYE